MIADEASAADGAEAREKTKGIRLLANRAVLLPILLAALIAPIWLVRYLPFQDYPDLLMQGAILRNWTSPALDLGQIYALRLVPVPRLITLPLLYLLSFLAPLESVGKLLVSIYLVAMPLSVIYLFRSIQRQATSTELTGFLLAYNYWLFQGSLDYALGIAIGCLSVGFLIRHWDRATPGHVVYLSALGALCYLAHIMAYVVLALVAGLWWLLARDRQKHLGALVACGLPGLLLFASYLALGGDGMGG